jgi:signal peptidase I
MDAVTEELSSAGSRPASSRSVFLYAVLALGIALFIRLFVAAPYVVQGASMEPTFDDWHYLIIDRLSYDFSEPRRGDVIVFDLPSNTGRALIKRVIGLPGETISIAGNAIVVYNAEHPEGLTLAEPYLSPGNLGGYTNTRTTLREDEYFVLGDNRRVSSDSRVWGVLPREDIVGRVLVRLFPVDRVQLFPGEARYEN